MAAQKIHQAPRIGDVAKHAGVAVGTVSNVLNNPAKVSAATLERVRQSIETLGFVRDANARSLAAGGSKSIGLVVIDLGNSIFVDVARGAQAAARESGLNLLLASSANDFSLQSDNVDFFNEARVAGMLLAPMEDSSEQISRLTRRGRPVVLVNYDPQHNENCCVVIDNEQVGFLAATHLIELGCRRIAMLGGSSDKQPVVLRRQGVRRAIATSGLPVRFEEVATADLEPHSGRQAATVIARRGPDMRPDGVVAVTDTLAAGFINEITRLGVSIPQEMAVMGCDSNSSAPHSVVPVTTVAMRGYEMGSAAMRLLSDEMTPNDGIHVHQRVVLDPELVIRGSTVATTP
jgi:LacI family transcriptional regulator